MKKLFSIILTMLMTLSLFSSVAYASESNLGKVADEVNKTNLKIEKMVNKAVEKANKETASYQKELAMLQKAKEGQTSEASIKKYDIRIEKLTNNYNEKIDKIIEKLTYDTNKMAATMKEKAAKKGVTVICELEQVEIGGRTVLIDPLRIIGF